MFQFKSKNYHTSNIIITLSLAHKTFRWHKKVEYFLRKLQY